ncbi:sensor histidine kinase [Paenibacillus antri]|uniref:histidine kinase n=1 Tax=Paenibacillus antri TaxID=2582848 RepID=A0A5R9GIN7_9BACL|nr:sensor histidine kinase [Paenibacillus antri]TLS52703.1 sensor histidine kinase [Paenibacillus antri]
MKRQRLSTRWLAFLTLKRRIILIFMITFLLPFAGITALSYYTINSMLTNKIHSTIRNNMGQVRLSLENAFSNMNHVSQQLAFQGSVGPKLGQFLEATEPYRQAELIDEINADLDTITYTNPNIGLTLYYFANDGTYKFENLNAARNFDPLRLPTLAEQYRVTYKGPHLSQDQFNNQYVLSVLRKVDLPERDDVYVYIESGFKLTQNILENNRFSPNTRHLILDVDGDVVYSELPGAFPQGTAFADGDAAAESGFHSGYYWFRGTSNQGWSIVSAIPKAEYMQERDLWLVQIAVFCLLFLAVTLGLAWLLWKMVYRPLNDFNREIRRMSKSNLEPITTASNIPEFSYLLKQMNGMKGEIRRLFREVEASAQRRADLEIEKLRYQINPHFLMNTLDTAHWLAVMKGQGEIDKLIVSLNKLLYYNLGKTGERTTVREELDALEQYLTLQKIRYDFDFNVEVETDERVLNLEIPRFILQPLVENALYHGLQDDGRILVRVWFDDALRIAVSDNGAGMSEETLMQVLHRESQGKEKVGMGIGMNYVKRTIESFYEGRAVMDIRSEVGHGTTVTLTLPAGTNGEERVS